MAVPIEEKKGFNFVGIPIQWIELFLFILFVTIASYGIPVLALFLGGGAEDPELFNKVIFYSAVGSGFLFGIVALRIIEFFATRSNEVYQKYGWAKAIIHEPRLGWLKGLPFYDFFTKFHILLILSVWFFSIMSFASVISGRFFTFVSLPPVQQQVTETARLALAVEPAASVETVMFMFLISLLFGPILWLRDSGRLTGNVPIDDLISRFLQVGAVLFFSFIWVGFHLIRYGADDTAIFATFVFGLIGGIFFLLSGSFIPWYIFHVMNNLVLMAKILFSSDLMLILSVIILLIITIVTLIVVGGGFFNRVRRGRG